MLSARSPGRKQAQIEEFLVYCYFDVLGELLINNFVKD